MEISIVYIAYVYLTYNFNSKTYYIQKKTERAIHYI